MITELTRKTLGKKKTGWYFDRKREVWITWQVDTTFNGARHVRRGFRTEQKAKDYIEDLKLQERLKRIGAAPAIKYPAARELFDRHLATIESPAERKRAEKVFKVFCALLPAGATVDEIKRKHFKDFSDLRLSEGVKADTVRREITPIASALNSAGNYYAQLEGWKPPRTYRPEGENSERDRVINKSERERLIQYLLADKGDELEKTFKARRRTGLLIHFGLLTGLRHGEICGLRKSDLTGRRLKAERFKTRKKGVSATIFEPLTDTQLWILGEAAKLYPESEYFFSENGKPYHRIYTLLKAVCEKLKIPYGRKTAGGLVIHDTRHTFVTTLEHGGMDSSTTRSFSGHSKEAMLKRYAHATFDSRTRAMQIIERELGNNGDNKTELKEVYERVRSGEMSFEEFKRFIDGFFA